MLPTVRHGPDRSRRPSASQSSMSYFRSAAGPVPFPGTQAGFPIRLDPTGAGNALPLRSLQGMPLVATLPPRQAAGNHARGANPRPPRTHSEGLRSRASLASSPAKPDGCRHPHLRSRASALEVKGDFHERSQSRACAHSHCRCC